MDSNPSPPRSPPRPRQRRWLRWLVLALVVALAVLRFTGSFERIAAAAAARALGADVTIARLTFEWPDRVVANGVVARVHGAATDFLELGRVAARVSLFPPGLDGVDAADAKVLLRERPDGTFELPTPPASAAPAGPPPAFRLERGRVELAGSGPLHDRLAGVLAEGVARSAEIPTLAVAPAPDGSFALNGVVIPGAVAHVRVHAAGKSGRLDRVRVDLDDGRPLDLVALRGVVAAPIAAWLAANELEGGLAGEARFAFGGTGPRFEADVDLLDVAMTAEVFPTTVSGLRGRLEFRGDTLHIPGLLGRHPPGAVRISGDVADLAGAHRSHVVARIDSAVVDEQLRRSLLGDKVGKLIVEALAPEGRYSVTATIDSHAGASPHVALDLELEDNALQFHGFLDETGRRHGLDVRVESIRGRVLAAPEASKYEQVTGFTRGGARVESSADITVERLAGSVSAFDLPIDEELVAAATKEVGPVVRSVVTTLGLSGTVDAVARFELDHAFHLAIEAHPKALKLRPPAFPYELEANGGTLVLEKERVRFDGVHGRSGDLNLRVSGFIDTTAPDAPLDLVVEAHDLPLDAKLLAAARALPDPRLADALARFRPEGRVDLSLSWRRQETGADLELVIDVVPTNVRLDLLDHALFVNDLRGAVSIRRVGDAPWQLELLRGGGLSARTLGGDVELSGQLADAPGAVASLRLVGRRLRVDDAFVAALRGVAPEFADLLGSHHVRGRVSVDCDLAPADGSLIPTRVDLAPDVAPIGSDAGAAGDAPDDGIAAEPPWLPLGLVWSGGTMHADLAARTVTFEKLVGRVGEAPLRVTDGTLRFAADGLDVRLALLADGLGFAETTELVLGPEKRKALTPYGPLGRTRADVRALHFHVPAGAVAVDQVEAEGAVDLDGWTLYTGGALKDLSGHLELDSLTYKDAGHGIADARAAGRVIGVNVDLNGLRFANLQADLLLDHGRLNVPWLAAEFAGGRLLRDRNRLGITLTGDMPFDGRLELLAADVSRILGDDVPRLRGLVGRLDADVGFHGRGRSLFRGQGLTSVEAAGAVEIHDAKLWNIPLFDKLYSLAVLPLTGQSSDDVDLSGTATGGAEPPRWERGHVEFALQGVYVHLSRFELEGEPLVLRGEGTLGPERLAMNFYPEVKTGFGLLRSIPILGPVVGFLLSAVEHEVGAFRFQGPYGNPEVEWDPVTLVPRPDLDIRLERPRTAAPRQESRPTRP